MGRRTLEDWHTIIKEQESSSLTIVDYYREKQLNPKTFSSRKTVLKQKTMLTRADKPADFIQVTADEKFTGSSISLKTKHVTLHLPPNVSPQWLARLLQEMSA